MHPPPNVHILQNSLEKQRLCSKLLYSTLLKAGLLQRKKNLIFLKLNKVLKNYKNKIIKIKSNNNKMCPELQTLVWIAAAFQLNSTVLLHIMLLNFIKCRTGTKHFQTPLVLQVWLSCSPFLTAAGALPNGLTALTEGSGQHKPICLPLQEPSLAQKMFC